MLFIKRHKCTFYTHTHTLFFSFLSTVEKVAFPFVSFQPLYNNHWLNVSLYWRNTGKTLCVDMEQHSSKVSLLHHIHTCCETSNNVRLFIEIMQPRSYQQPVTAIHLSTLCSILRQEIIKTGYVQLTSYSSLGPMIVNSDHSYVSTRVENAHKWFLRSEIHPNT